jgi:Cupin-like domain
VGTLHAFSPGGTKEGTLSSGSAGTPWLDNKEKFDDDSPFKLRPISKVVAKEDFDLDRDYYDFMENGNCGRPILIEAVLSEEKCQECCQRLMSVADTLQVDLQEQSQETGTQIYQLALSQAIEVIMRRSNSRKAFFAFCEGLLEEDPVLMEIQRIVTSVREVMFRDDPDLFPDFPVQVQPTDAVILAGAGATSTLHRDPMEWTGTSLCLEGTKIWRFLEPPVAMEGQRARDRVLTVDEALESYRLASVAWQSDEDDTDSVSLSAGWQSDFSLFRECDHDSIPSAQVLAEMDDKEKMQLLQKLNTLKILGPDIPRNAAGAIHTVIQKPGDLLLIPAHWWHQTYALEPSVAIASQRCGTKDLGLVLDHMWSQVHGDDTSRSRQPSGEYLDFSSRSPQKDIVLFFDELMR